MLLLASIALASSSSASFAVDSGAWSGGTVSDGVLEIADASATLDLGVVSSFTFAARMRLASGDQFSVGTGSLCTFIADYTGAQALSLDNASVPFNVDELAFTASSQAVVEPDDLSEAAGVGDPDVVSFGGQWWMFYTATDLGSLPAVHAATSADLTTWTRLDTLELDGGAEPTAIDDDGTLVVYYTAGGTIYRTTTTDGTSFSFPTVALSPGPDFDSSGLGDPSILRGADGTWHLWYSVTDSGATGHAISNDGLGFTRSGELSTDGSRLAALDVTDGTFGFEGVYTMLDSVGFAPGGDDPEFIDATADIRPALAMNDTSWSEGGFGSAAAVRDNAGLTLFVDGVDSGQRVIGRVDTAPAPGGWGSLVLRWDGTTLTASWNDGPDLTCALSNVGPFVVTATGTAELDEVRVDYSGTATTDTADTGTPHDSGADTAAGDTGDSALDSADTGALGFNAGEWLGEPGGCGCQSTSPPRATPVLTVFASLLLIRAALVRPARTA